MWLFTELGFFSIVKKSPGEWHLRARVREDLDNIAALSLPGDPKVVKSYPGSDYPWRMILDKRAKAALFVRLSKIEYGNFKGRIAQIEGQRDKLHAYHDVWALMRQLHDRCSERA